MTHPITKLIQDAIIKAGCTKVDAAKLCGLPLSTMYALASGERGAHPSVPTLRKLSAGLDIPLDDLLVATGREPEVATSHTEERLEQAHLVVLRDLNERDRRVVMTLAKELRRLT